MAPLHACHCCGGASLAACSASTSKEEAGPVPLQCTPLPVKKTRTLLLCDPYLSLCGGGADWGTGPQPSRCGVVQRGVVCGPEGDAFPLDACVHTPVSICSVLGTHQQPSRCCCRPLCPVFSCLPASCCIPTTCTVIARFRFPKTLLFVLVPSFYTWHFDNIPKAATAAGKNPLGGRLLTGREVLRCFVFFVLPPPPFPLFTFLWVYLIKQPIGLPQVRLPQHPTLLDNSFSPLLHSFTWRKTTFFFFHLSFCAACHQGP